MGQFISFTLGEEEYGLAITAIREIRGWTEITALPDAPPHIRGVLDLRGRIVPIVDLRARFGQGPTDVGPRHVIIVAAAGDRMAGLLVDAVADILTVADADIQPVPMEAGASSQLLSGLVSVDGRLVTVLRLDALLDHHSASAVTAAA